MVTRTTHGATRSFEQAEVDQKSCFLLRCFSIQVMRRIDVMKDIAGLWMREVMGRIIEGNVLAVD